MRWFYLKGVLVSMHINIDCIRPDLTWRDVQRLSIESAIIVNPTDSDWIKNGAGRIFNHKYGYGTFDVYSLLENTKTFKNVGPQMKVVLSSLPNLALNIDGESSTGINQTLSVNLSVADGMLRLEHVEVTVQIKHQKRGDIAINLISPSGFVSRLMEPRRWDDSKEGFKNWRMMSVAHWYTYFLVTNFFARDENPIGNWTLVIVDNVDSQNAGVLEKWSLTLWGETTRNSPPASIVASGEAVLGANVSKSTADQSLNLNITGESINTSVFFVLIIFVLIICGISYMIYSRSRISQIVSQGYRRSKVVLEKEIDQEDVTLQEYDEEHFDELIYDHLSPDAEDPLDV